MKRRSTRVALNEKIFTIEGVQRVLQNEIMRKVEGSELGTEAQDQIGDYIDL